MSSSESEERYASDVERVYRNDEIEVTWSPSFCTHVAACISGAPEVFTPKERPWIHVDATDAQRIRDVVERCPTGALHARLLKEPEPVAPAETTDVAVQQDGPLFVRGSVRIVAADGRVVRQDTRLALCRCGASSNKPYCDDSHYRIGFKG